VQLIERLLLSDDNPAYKFTSIVNASTVNILVEKPDLATIGFGRVSSFGAVISSISQTTPDVGLRSVISDIVDASTDTQRESYIKTLLPEANGAKFDVSGGVVQKNFNIAQTRMNKVRSFASAGTGLSTGDSMNLKSSWVNFFNKDIGQGYRDGEFGYDADIKGVTLGFDFHYDDNTIIGR
jgi:hypothetical protein